MCFDDLKTKLLKASGYHLYKPINSHFIKLD